MSADEDAVDLTTAEAIEQIVGRLEPDELATLLWLIEEPRVRFGAAGSFDPANKEFDALANQLASKVI